MNKCRTTYVKTTKTIDLGYENMLQRDGGKSVNNLCYKRRLACDHVFYWMAIALA